MEGCQTFKPFLVDVINIVEPERVHIELQEIPVLPQRPMNLRTRKYQEKKQPWRMVSLNPKKDNRMLDPFIEMLSNEQFFIKRIRRIGIICKDNLIREGSFKNPESNFRHYIFGQQIELYKPIEPKAELSYVDIRDIQFESRSLKNTRTLFDSDLEKANTNIREDNESNDLPF